MPNHKITKINTQKNTGRLNIYLDGNFGFGVTQQSLQDYDLHIGKSLDDKTMAKIKSEDVLKKCLNKSYRYLAYRPRSKAEVQNKLLEKFDPKTVDLALKKLEDLNYVNDEDFVNFWIEARSKNRGPQLLKQELFQKGIDKEKIEAGLGSISPEQNLTNAMALVSSKRKYNGLAKDEAYKRVAPFLSRRGYDYDIIKEVIKNIS